MTAAVEIPVWLLLLIGLLAGFSLVGHFLVPGARWFLRRRVNRVIDEVNTRLSLELPSFKLTRRQVLIDRLSFDPKILAEVEREARERGLPREALMAEVATYAREIVPAFNAYVYFRFGYRLARAIAKFLYRVRLGSADDEALAGIGPESSVVFVMNHRSNMDYVLVSYLAADRTSLSYAVGEWARVWPLQQLIRALGAYFVRRNSKNPLYRRVLERFVQMSTEAGVPQAVYPEGGLSRDGRPKAPKLGLLDYMTRDFDPTGARDIVFLPVGLNYDRVLEDRSLTLSLESDRPRRSAGFALRTTIAFLGHNFALMARRRWYRFGYACVNFGTPISFKDWIGRRVPEAAALNRAATWPALIQALGDDLMAAICQVVPVLPVSLIATLLRQAGPEGLSELALKARAHGLIEQIRSAGGHVYIPRADADYAIAVGLRMMVLRHLAQRGEDGLYRVPAGEAALVDYYANSIAHLIPDRRRAAAE